MTDTPTPRPPRARRGRRRAAALAAAALVLASAGTAGPARADDSAKTGHGADGQALTVAKTAGIDPSGERIRVTGAGYDETKGIYVALCKDNGSGRVPSPCLGGADTTGGGEASKWIVPEGDVYEGDLAQAYGPGGSFDVEIEVKAEGNGLDCMEVACSVVTRVDHRGGGDRSQDVRVPVAFEGQDPGDPGGGTDVPPGTVGYRTARDITAAGKPLDTLLHPDSGKLYVAADNVADTPDTDERGLYALDAADGKVLSWINQAPGPTGALRTSGANRIAAPLPGDGVAYIYPLRGLGRAKAGDRAAAGVWLSGSTVTDAGPGLSDATVLVAQGAQLSELDTATGAVKRTLALDNGGRLAVDAKRGTAWFTDFTAGKLYRVGPGADADSLAVTATVPLPSAGGSAGFTAVDPATGDVWVGVDKTFLVFDAKGTLRAALTGADAPRDVAFDATAHQAFVVRQDGGDLGDPANDNNGELDVYDTATLKEAAAPLPLPGNHGQAGAASVTVRPGGGTVWVTNPPEAKITELVRQTSPRVTEAPRDASAAAGASVSLTARAEGEPAPSVRWQVSPDGGQTWQDVEGATSTTYTFTAKAAQDGYAYRAVFRNDAGTTRTGPAVLTVTPAGGGNGGGDGGTGDPGEPSGTRTVTGENGQKLTVTPVNGLAVEDQTITVTGSGYDEDKGVYVALCVDNGPGEQPTPCIGGVDMTGASHSSAWISSNPPDYGEGLAQPYGDGGTFEVELTVDARDAYTDCFKATCVLATRADHTLSGDRSQDVKVPVSFVGQDPVDTDDGSAAGGADGGSTSGASSSASGGTGSSTTTASGGTGASASGGGGSLASTGTTALTLAGAAAALTALGWTAFRRGRRAAAASD